MANEYPVYWNNYFLWDDTKPKPTIVVYDNDANEKFDLLRDYARTIQRAILESFENTNEFILQYQNSQ